MAIAGTSRERSVFVVVDQIVRTFFSIVRASINGSVGIGRSSLRIECGGDCSNLKV